jgi:SAM-dependent methyltransferase
MRHRRPGPRFEDLTETTGIPLSQEAADMMYTRYRVAAAAAHGRRVLELGCGAGQGLGLIGRSARLVVGGDFSRPLLHQAQRHYGKRFPLVRLTGDCLPFQEHAFELVLCFEASYYVPDMAQGFREIARVLRPGGVALFANANPERPDFIKSPHSTHYHTTDEFRASLAALGLEVDAHGAFPTAGRDPGLRAHAQALALRLARRGLETLHLVPRTLRGRARLKRLIYGRLREVPAELTEGFATETTLTPLARGPVREFKVIYVSARKPS